MCPKRGEETYANAGPLTADPAVELEDQALVARARAGERDALEALVERQQPWIYNFALRMLYHPQDAEDATQEVLVKAINGLASFEGRSCVRTWLYRIVVNHVLNTKRGRREPEVLTFGCYAHGLDAMPDVDLPDERTAGRRPSAGRRSADHLHDRHAALSRPRATSDLHPWRDLRDQ